MEFHLAAFLHLERLGSSPHRSLVKRKFVLSGDERNVKFVNPVSILVSIRHLAGTLLAHEWIYNTVQNLKHNWQLFSVPDNSSAVLVTNICYNIQVRRPELEFSLPVNDGWQWSTDEERALAMTFLVQRVQEGDCLNSFAQTHLVGQYCVDAVCPWVPEPVYSIFLVFM